MFWLQRNPTNSIEKLLENPDTTLNQVLKDSSFASASRNPSKSLMNFLLAEKNFNILINLALSNDLKVAFNSTETTENDNESDNEKRKKEFNKIQRSAVLVLSSQSKIFQSELSKSSILQNKLNDFPNSDYSSDPKICGHYSRIVEALLRSSSGKYLYQVPNIIDFLITKINILPCRELLVILFCDFTILFIKCNSGVEYDDAIKAELFTFSNDDDDDSLDEDENEKSEDSKDSFNNITTKEERDALIHKFLFTDKIKSGESTFFIFSALNAIFTQKSDLTRYFATPECFRQILSIATSAEQKQLGSIEAFKAASHIINWSSEKSKISALSSGEISSIIKEIDPQFNLQNRPSIDGITAFAARIFTNSASQLINKIFSNETNTFLNEAILNGFKKLSWNDQLRLVNEKDLTHQIILSFITLDQENNTNLSTYVTNDNGYITELARFLNSEFEFQKKAGNNNDECKCFESEEWQNFVATILIPHVNQRDTFDNINSTSDSSEIEEDEFTDDEIEEEEEEEIIEEVLDMSDDEEDGNNKKISAEQKDSQLQSISDDDEVESGKEVNNETKVTTTDTSVDQLPKSDNV